MKMPAISGDMMVKLAIGAAVVGGAVFLLYKIKGAAGAAVDAIADTAGTIADKVASMPADAVTGAGKWVGIPETSVDACAAAKAAGDKWGASFACPAGDFLSWLTSSSSAPADLKNTAYI